jgi:hypothetical protein
VTEAVDEPVAEIRFTGKIHVRPFRRGTYLGDDHVEMLIERALGNRYRFGAGWDGHAEVVIVLRERPPAGEAA